MNFHPFHKIRVRRLPISVNHLYDTWFTVCVPTVDLQRQKSSKFSISQFDLKVVEHCYRCLEVNSWSSSEAPRFNPSRNSWHLYVSDKTRVDSTWEGTFWQSMSKKCKGSEIWYASKLILQSGFLRWMSYVNLICTWPQEMCSALTFTFLTSWWPHSSASQLEVKSASLRRSYILRIA
jgi:hypothetical protein